MKFLFVVLGGLVGQRVFLSGRTRVSRHTNYARGTFCAGGYYKLGRAGVCGSLQCAYRPTGGCREQAGCGNDDRRELRGDRQSRTATRC